MKRRFLIVFTMIFALVLGLGVLSACGGNGSNGDLTISESEVTLAVGDSTNLTATITDKNDKSDINWSSSNENVVTVRAISKKGFAKIEAVGAGKATVTAESTSGKKVSCAVTVENIVVEISGEGVANGKLQIERGTDVKLSAAVKKDGQVLSGETVSWGSSNSEVLTVAADGTVSALKEGTATVTATRKGGGKAELAVTVVWTEKPTDYYELEAAGQNKMLPNTWGYWADIGYETANVSVSSAEYLGNADFAKLTAGDVTFTYVNAGGENEHGMQLFYRSSKGYNASNANNPDFPGYTPYDENNLMLAVNSYYILKMDITVSESGTITVNGTQVDVVANQKQSLSIPFQHTDDGRIHAETDYINLDSAVFLMMGANGKMIQAATVTIKNVKWEPWDGQSTKLTAPSLTVSGKTVSINDTNAAGVKDYTVGLFAKGAAANADPVRSVTTAEKSLTLDDSKWPNGEYELRVRANSKDKSYTNSDWSTGASYTVSHGAVQYDLKEGGSEVALPDLSDTYYYYVENANVTEAKYNEGTVTLTFDGNWSWTSLQLFYKNPSLENGTKYTLTFNLNVSNMTHTDGQAPKIRINGSMYEIKEGDNPISIVYTEAAGKLSLDIQFGEPTGDYQGTVGCISAGTFVFSNIEWKVYEAPEGSLPEGGESVAVADPGTFYLWWDQGWNGASVTIKESHIDYEAKTIQFSYTSTGDDFYGAGVQLFYKLPGAVTGNEYKITLTIKVSVDCTIRVCGQVEEFKAGVERTLTITKAEAASSTLSIIMGTYESADNFTNVKEADVTISNWNIEGETQKPVDPSDYTFGEDILPSTNAMVNSGKNDDGKALDTFMYWYVQRADWNCGSVVTMKQNTYENGTITLGYQGGDRDFSVQLFYGNSHMTAGKEYKISFTVTATKDMTIKVNEKQFKLKAGEATQIEQIFTLATNQIVDVGPWAADIQLPGMSDEVTVTISGLKWNEATKK